MAALVIERSAEPFEGGSGRVLSRIAAAVSESIERIDREWMIEVRDRIDRKIMDQLRPQDLFYEILDGLRSLTRYDHSSALLIRDDGEEALRPEAEQIAWTKGKSRRAGLRLALDKAPKARWARARSRASSGSGTSGGSGAAGT